MPVVRQHGKPVPVCLVEKVSDAVDPEAYILPLVDRIVHQKGEDTQDHVV